MTARPSNRGPVTTRTAIVFVLLTCVFATLATAGEVPARPRIAPEVVGEPFRLLTANTSTLERKLNEAAAQGYVFAAMMGGKTLGNDAVVVVMSRQSAAEARPVRYKVLSTNETSMMQRELDAMGAFGFRYRGQSIAETSFGSLEVIVILERDAADREAQYDYQLVAATSTATMQTELNELSRMGFEVEDVTVSKTALGGNEVVTILSRRHGRAAGD